MNEISEELKTVNLRDFYMASLNIVRDSEGVNAAIHLVNEMKRMHKDNCTNDYKRDHIIRVLVDTFLNKSR